MQSAHTDQSIDPIAQGRANNAAKARAANLIPNPTSAERLAYWTALFWIAPQVRS